MDGSCYRDLPLEGFELETGGHTAYVKGSVSVRERRKRGWPDVVVVVDR
jgi:hypothetical protein